MPLEENAKKILDSSESDDSAETDSCDKSVPITSDIQPEGTPQEDANIESDETLVEAQQPETALDKNALDEYFQKLVGEVARLRTEQQELELKVIQTLRENAGFQIQVRQNMQKELEEARKKLSGDSFIPLLREIAEIYVEWQDVLEDMDDGPARRKVTGIFELLYEILEEYGCEFGTSQCDTKRRSKYSKLRNKVPVSDKSRHETIAHSHNPYIVKEPFVLYPEYVDVYVYDKSLIQENIDDIAVSTAEEAITSFETSAPTSDNKEE